MTAPARTRTSADLIRAEEPVLAHNYHPLPVVVARAEGTWVEDVEGRMERMNVDHKPAGGLYPTSQWKAGETVKDEFNVYLPASASPRALNLWLGLWEPRTDSRLRLTNPEAVRNDGKDRILLGQVPVAR